MISVIFLVWFVIGIVNAVPKSCTTKGSITLHTFSCLGSSVNSQNMCTDGLGAYSSLRKESWKSQGNTRFLCCGAASSSSYNIIVGIDNGDGTLGVNHAGPFGKATMKTYPECGWPAPSSTSGSSSGPKKVDCKYGPWKESGPCVVKKGSSEKGMIKMTRTIVQLQQHGGKACTGPTTMEQGCKVPPKVHASVSARTTPTACSSVQNSIHRHFKNTASPAASVSVTKGCKKRRRRRYLEVAEQIDFEFEIEEISPDAAEQTRNAINHESFSEKLTSFVADQTGLDLDELSVSDIKAKFLEILESDTPPFLSTWPIFYSVCIGAPVVFLILLCVLCWCCRSSKQEVIIEA